MRTKKKPTFRPLMKEWVRAQLHEEFDNLNDFQRSFWMTRYFVLEVLRPLNPGLFAEDEEDLEDSFLDGAHDSGVDFLWADDGRVVLIQTKYRGTGRNEKREDFEDFCSVLKRLHPRLGSEYPVAERVREVASGIDWEKDQFELYYVTLGKKTVDVQACEGAGQQPLEGLEDLPDRVSLTCYDESDLNDLLREAISASEGIQAPVNLLLSEDEAGLGWLTYENPDGRRSFVGTISAGQIRNLYAKYRQRLFSSNIRNYVGDTSTNKQIRESASEEPGNFFFFNNGLSAIATKIRPDPDGRTLSCDRFSIINGAQSVRSLHKAHKDAPERVGEVEVLIRVSEVSLKRDEEEAEFLDNITRFNNTQNAIKISDFRSNDPVQSNLASRFSGLPSRGGKKFWYKNKRTGRRDAKRIPIGLEDLAKSTHAFRNGPADFFDGTKYLFDTGPDGGYRKVFGDPKEPLTDEEFQLLAGTWFVCDCVREFHKALRAEFIEREEAVATSETEKARSTPVAKGALERRWMVYFVVGELLRERYKIDDRALDNDLRTLHKPKWLDSSKGTRSALEAYTKVACETLMRTYRGSAKDPQFTHRYWFKNRVTMTDIREEVVHSRFVVEHLPFL